jgi:hypothetical protein
MPYVGREIFLSPTEIVIYFLPPRKYTLTDHPMLDANVSTKFRITFAGM